MTENVADLNENQSKLNSFTGTHTDILQIPSFDKINSLNNPGTLSSDFIVGKKF